MSLKIFISRKRTFLHDSARCLQFANLGFGKVEDDHLCLVTSFDVLNVQRRMMPSRREVEREILKLIRRLRISSGQLKTKF